MSFEKIKERIDSVGPELVRKVGKYINPFLLKFKNENKHLLVFYFHGLFETVEQKNLNHIDPQTNITVEEFINFIEYFQQHNFKFILPEDIGKRGEENRPCAMITFDDGYFNNRLAIDVLNRYKIPATFFLSTKNIVENKSFWWDIIYRNRIKAGVSLKNIRKEQASLKSFKNDHIETYILKHFGKEAFIPWSEIDRPFNSKEIIKLSSNPYVAFGNHTHNHSILTNNNKEEILNELNVSNKILLELTGKIPKSIAFPNGNYNKLVLKTTQEIGFQFAFTTEKGHNLFPRQNQNFMCLKRFLTKPSNINEYGSFCRMNYEPNDFYYKLKLRILSGMKF